MSQQREASQRCELVRVGDTRYPVLKTLAHRRVRRLLVGDPDRKRGGLKFQVIVLPRDDTSKQHLRSLERISQSNQNLPTVVRCHYHRESTYLVTTWVDGRDLEHVLNHSRRKGGSWPSVHQTCRLARGLAHGLHHINDQCSLVHGDIAPRNLVVTHKMRKLVLVDFGSDWAIERAAMRENGDGHTRGYAAPEMIEPSGIVDFRADQFSLSCVAYKMLTDRLPYDGLGGVAGAARYRESEIQLIPPSGIAVHQERFPRRVWSKIDEVVCRGLALDPNKRYLGTKPWLADWDRVMPAIENPEPVGPVEALAGTFRALFRRDAAGYDR